MEKLFVSFVGNKRGQHANGWVVLFDIPKITEGPEIEELCSTIERLRGYDHASVVIINFRRLEK